jgi:hypothetical protein
MTVKSGVARNRLGHTTRNTDHTASAAYVMIMYVRLTDLYISAIPLSIN